MSEEVYVDGKSFAIEVPQGMEIKFIDGISSGCPPYILVPKGTQDQGEQEMFRSNCKEKLDGSEGELC